MPRGKPFTKGDARINRKGRPKVGESISDMFEDALKEKLNGDYTKLDSLIDMMITKALKGDQAAGEYVLARVYGKIIERIESTNRNVNQNYDFSQIPLEERKRVWEIMKSGRNSRTDNPIN